MSDPAFTPHPQVALTLLILAFKAYLKGHKPEAIALETRAFQLLDKSPFAYVDYFLAIAKRLSPIPGEAERMEELINKAEQAARNDKALQLWVVAFRAYAAHVAGDTKKTQECARKAMGLWRGMEDEMSEYITVQVQRLLSQIDPPLVGR